jgi:hypothetical protein
MRPRLRNDVFFVPTEAGVFCLDGDTRHYLTGHSLYRWIERLTPYLDGQHTVAELTAELPVERRVAVERLVGELHQLNLVRDLSAQQPHSLNERELLTYAPEIAYLEDLLDDAHSRFQRYRETPVLAIGSGTALFALVRAIAQSGIRDVTVAGPEDDALRELLAERADVDPHQRIHWGAGPIGESTLVLHMADASTPDPTVLDARVAAAGGMVVQAVFTGDEAFVGPFVVAERPETGWRAAWEFSRRAVELVDAEFGVVRAVEELHFAQFPLRLARADVAGAVAFGAALESGPARSAAVRRGLELYCARLVDPRRLVDGMVRGFSVLDGSEVLLPVKDVYPTVPCRELPVGVASGPTWTDAVQAGMLAHSRRLAVDALSAGAEAFARVEDVELDEVGARYRELVRLLGKQIDIYDIRVVPGAEVFAFCVDGHCVAYQAGLTAAAALRDGYEVLLLDHQSRANRQLAYAPPAVPALPTERMGAPLRTPRQHTMSLAEGLSDRKPVAVPLDHDPAVRVVLPNVVRVVLVDA